MEPLKIEAYTPQEIAKRVATVAEKKSALDFFRSFVLAILAGAFIGLGAEFFTLVIHDSSLSTGLTSLIGGTVFSLGLILIILAGSWTFYGKYPYGYRLRWPDDQLSQITQKLANRIYR